MRKILLAGAAADMVPASAEWDLLSVRACVMNFVVRKIFGALLSVVLLGALHSSAALAKPMTFTATSQYTLVASGTITASDTYQRFLDAADRMPRLVFVMFDSRGGSVMEAIALGNEIRRRGLSTVVPMNKECTSACVWAFLGGLERLPLGAMGIHPLSYNDYAPTSQAVGDIQVVLAMLSMYLDDLGIPHRILNYSMLGSLDEVYYMSPEFKQYSCVTTTGDRTLLGFNPQCRYSSVLD